MYRDRELAQREALVAGRAMIEVQIREREEERKRAQQQLLEEQARFKDEARMKEEVRHRVPCAIVWQLQSCVNVALERLVVLDFVGASFTVPCHLHPTPPPPAAPPRMYPLRMRVQNV